jgi:hypothetical protein
VKLNAQIFERLRLSDLEGQIFDYLHTLDNGRFRLLGIERTLEVAKTVIRYGDYAEVEFVENYKYIAFMAYFLGSYFYEDHRYHAINQWLTYKGTTSNDRVKEAHLIFRAGAERFIGADFCLTKAALKEFQGLVNRCPLANVSEERVFEYFCRSYQLSADEIAFFDYERLRSDGRESAQILDVTNPLGYGQRPERPINLVLPWWQPRE